MATLVRIPALHTITDSGDFLYATTDIAIWSTLEIGLGITASTMPTLKPLLSNFFERSRILTSKSKRFGSSSSKSMDSSTLQHDSGRTNNRLDVSMTEPRGATVTTQIHVPNYDEEMDIASHDGGPDCSSTRDDVASVLKNDSHRESDIHRAWNVKVSKSIVQTHYCI